MIAQSLARHARLPGIVLLLGAGVLLGPDVLDLVRPETLGTALQVLVGFAVAVVLFEGGMNLNLSRLKHQARVIRRLLTIGVAVTAIGGAAAAHFVLGWDWRLSALFGTLVVVTGPTVITPLLRRIKVNRRLETVLEAEGVLIDPIGALLAILALEVVLRLAHSSELAPAAVASVQSGTALGATLVLFARLGFGVVVGVAAGFLIAILLRFERVVPEGMENVFTLSLVLALFQLSNNLVEESGLMTVTIAGVVVGNVRTRVQRDLAEFKEQLTVLLTGMLFVLLAANVRVGDVQALGWGGLATVAALMIVVRPLNILVSTRGSGLTWREKLFLSWLAPRGIVAAAIAALFAQELTHMGIPGGRQLQALVFMVIAMTVLIQGLSGGPVARLLGVRRPVNRGYAILGANELGHALGRTLRDSGEDVVFLDSNPTACHTVEQDGFKVVFGNVLEERTLQRARIEDRAACVAITPNEEANLLFAQRALAEHKVGRAYVAIARASVGVNESVVMAAGGRILFGAPRDLDLWALRMRRKLAPIEIWRCPPDPRAGDSGKLEFPENLLLPLVVWRGSRVFPVNRRDGLRGGDVVHIALFAERREEAHEWLRGRGWKAAHVEQRTVGAAAPIAEPVSV